MSNIAFKIPVIEAEIGQGRKIDDWMIVLSEEDAELFKEEFNRDNILSYTPIWYGQPTWYIQVEGPSYPINVSDNQMNELKKRKRMWLSHLRKVE